MPMLHEKRNLLVAQKMIEERQLQSCSVRGEIQLVYKERQSSGLPSYTESGRMMKVYRPQTHVDRVRKLRCPNIYPFCAAHDGVKAPAAKTVPPVVGPEPERRHSRRSIEEYLGIGLAPCPPSSRANRTVRRESTAIAGGPDTSRRQTATGDHSRSQPTDSDQGLRRNFLFPALSYPASEHFNASPVQQVDGRLVIHKRRRRVRKVRFELMPNVQGDDVRRNAFDAGAIVNSSDLVRRPKYSREDSQTTLVLGQRTRPDSTVEFEDLIITRSAGQSG